MEKTYLLLFVLIVGFLMYYRKYSEHFIDYKGKECSHESINTSVFEYQINELNKTIR